MKKIFFLISLTALLLSSCDKHHRVRLSGNLTAKTFDNYTQLTGIEIGDAATLYISQGTEDKLTITTDENALPYLVVRKSGESVSVYFEDVSFWGRSPELIIDMQVRDLKNLNLSGAAYAYIETDSLACDYLRIRMSGASLLEGVIKANRLSVDANGASKWSGQIFANTLSAELSGASRIDLSGYCERLNLELSGASQCYGYGLECDDLKADYSGASKSECTVLKTLSAELSGASTLYYDGDPNIVHCELSGGSNLKRR